jgi:hypothetical protein
MADLSDSSERPRSLVYIPIVHTSEDLGSLGEAVRTASVRRVGRTAWKRKSQALESLWARIEEVVKQLPVAWSNVRIYQDGLPISGRESELVQEPAKSGSRNHQIILDLMGRGATIMGTESPQLLVEEYELAKLLVSAAGMRRAKKTAKLRSASLLEERDRFIARRINETLEKGETGILFLGVLHSLTQWLDEDISVSYPVGRPGFANLTDPAR